MNEDTGFFDNLGREYDAKFLNLNHQGARLVYRTYADLIANHIPSDNSNILEIGCGSGIFLRYLRKKGYKNTYGMDLSLRILEYAHSKDKCAKHVRGDAQSLPFKEFFNCVVLQDALHHIRDIDRCFSEIEKVLVPGGVIVILDPNKKNFLGEVIRKILKKMKLLTPTERALDMKAIEKSTKKAGFSIKETGYFGVVSFPLSGIVFGRTILPNSHWLFDKLLAFDKKIASTFISEYFGWKILVVAQKR